VRKLFFGDGSLKKSNSIYIDSIECKYCGRVVDQFGSWNADRNWCRYNYPNCVQSHKNFKRMLENALKDRNKNIRLTAEWIEEQLKYGIPPKVFHPLLSLTRQTKQIARQIRLVKKQE